MSLRLSLIPKIKSDVKAFFGAETKFGEVLGCFMIIGTGIFL